MYYKNISLHLAHLQTNEKKYYKIYNNKIVRFS